MLCVITVRMCRQEPSDIRYRLQVLYLLNRRLDQHISVLESVYSSLKDVFRRLPHPHVSCHRVQQPPQEQSQVHTFHSGKFNDLRYKNMNFSLYGIHTDKNLFLASFGSQSFRYERKLSYKNVRWNISSQGMMLLAVLGTVMLISFLIVILVEMPLAHVEKMVLMSPGNKRKKIATQNQNCKH